MLRRKTLVVISVTLLCLILVITLASGFLSGGQKVRYNVVEVYILNWDTNSTDLGDGIDVQFRISIDLNGNGTYESIGESEIFHNTSVEVVPFRLGDAVQTGMSEFQFKVEVFRISNGTAAPMHYVDVGQAPVNTGVNEVYSSKVWNYDATNASGHDDLACRISYVYYVNYV